MTERPSTHQDLVVTALRERPQGFIDVVEIELARTLPGAGTLGTAARDLVMASGAKRARPWLVQLFGEVVGVGGADLVNAAVAVELIHTASLLHDDVIDDASVRRGRPTANTLFGSTLAVLSGDLLLVRALDRLTHLPRLMAPTVATVAEMTLAIADEVEARGNPDFTLEGWIAMARGKTGSLFGLCGRLAALLGEDEARGAAWAEAGAHLGVAFQIADDIADLCGTPGKGRYNDLRTGSPSYPVLWAASRSPALVEDLQALWSAPPTSERLEAVGGQVLELGAVVASTQAANRAIEEARAALGPDVGARSLSQLLGWAEALVQTAALGSA